jgi:hypothetical protein
VLHPNQFEVNEAWIAFQLNDRPIRTERDGSFNRIALMDAASCFMFRKVMIGGDQMEPSKLQVRRLLEQGWAKKKQYPTTLFVPTGRFQSILPTEAKRHGISVVPVHESQLLIFTSEARQGFRERFEM